MVPLSILDILIYNNFFLNKLLSINIIIYNVELTEEIKEYILNNCIYVILKPYNTSKYIIK